MQTKEGKLVRNLSQKAKGFVTKAAIKRSAKTAFRKKGNQ